MQKSIPSASRRRLRGRVSLRAEAGGALIEVMMAALLTALVATAVFAGIDGATAVSSGSKSRAVASAIAQDDQERLRATPPASLVGRNETRTVSRGGVNYTVVSTTRWAADREGTPDCDTVVPRAGYLRILSTVTWPDMRGSRPIVVSSLVAPPTGSVTNTGSVGTTGAVGVKAYDHQTPANPLAGVNVTISALGLSGTTDANGCVFWDNVPAGNYSYTASKAGHIDYNGNTSVTRPIGVAGGQTRIDSVYFGPAATMNINYVTRRYNGSEQPVTATTADTVFLTNAKMAALGGVRTFPGQSGTSRSLSGLFPQQYGVYLGPCERENNPAEYSTGTAVPYPFPTPSSKVWFPAINVRVRIFGSYTNDVDVKFTLQSLSGSTCTRTYTKTTTNVSGVGAGALTNPELPYGRYSVCAEEYAGGWYRARTTIDNTNTAGTSVVLSESMAESGRC